jgi:hypothetical protein
VSKILRSALLAPGIVEEVLDGRADHPLMLEQLERPLPVTLCPTRALPGQERVAPPAGTDSA